MALQPNDLRVLVKRVVSAANPGKILMAGQLVAGENLLVGTVVATAEGSKFRTGQIVYYSEYSAAAVMDMAKFFKGEYTLSQVYNVGNMMTVVPEDDIMAYETEDVEIKEEDTKELEATVKGNEKKKNLIAATDQIVVPGK